MYHFIFSISNVFELPRNKSYFFLSDQSISTANRHERLQCLAHCYFLLLYIHAVMTITNGQDLEHGVHGNVML